MTKRLELHSFYISLDDIPNVPLYYLSLPKSWRDFISSSRKPNSFNYPFLLNIMGEKLASVLPDLISTHFHQEVIEKGDPCLISTKKIDTDVIKMMCLEWFKQQLKKDKQTDLPIELINGEWQWLPLPLEYCLNTNYAFNIVPAIFAYDFSMKTIDLYNEAGSVKQLNFYRANNELISEEVEIAKGDYYSYFVTFELVTRGGYGDQYFLNLKTGIRRYLKNPLIIDDKCYLSGKTKKSVYVSIDNPYTSSGISKYSFAKLQFKRVGKEVRWANDIDRIYSDVLINRDDFNPVNILKYPERYIRGFNGIKALVVLSPTDSSFNTNVQPGAGLPERREVFKTFKLRYPQLIPVEPLEEVKPKRLIGITRRTPWIENHPELLEMEVWSESKSFYYKTVGKLQEIFNLSDINKVSFQDCEYFTIKQSNFEECNLRVSYCQPGFVNSELDDNTPAASMKRIKLIKKHLNQAKISNPIMSLVEIEPYHKNDGREDFDPKTAIRKGMLETGRLTQFIIVKEEEALEHKIENSIYDLFADRGFFRENWNSLDIKGDIVGIYKLKIDNKHIPVISWIHDNVLLLKIYSDEQWRTIDQLLLNIGRNDLNTYSINTNNKPAFLAYINSIIKEILKSTSDEVYVFAEASLRGTWWPGLKNGEIEIDKLPFDDPVLRTNSRLKFLRVNNTFEVPYYDITNENKQKNKEINRESGLFKDKNGIYYSVGNRPDTMQERMELTKFDVPNKPIGKQQLIELIPLGFTDEEERDKLAFYGHELRRVNLTFDKHTVLPFHLHRLKAVEKYMEDLFSHCK